MMKNHHKNRIQKCAKNMFAALLCAVLLLHGAVVFAEDPVQPEPASSLPQSSEVSSEVSGVASDAGSDANSVDSAADMDSSVPADSAPVDSVPADGAPADSVPSSSLGETDMDNSEIDNSEIDDSEIDGALLDDEALLMMLMSLDDEYGISPMTLGEDNYLAKVTAITLAGTTDPWVIYLQKVIQNTTGITAPTDTDKIVWASAPGASVWDGSMLGMTSLTATTTVTKDTTDPDCWKYYADAAQTQLVLAVDNPTTNTTARVYHVYTAAALRYVMQREFTDIHNKGTLQLEADIDLNGANYDWLKANGTGPAGQVIAMNQGQAFDGNGHTIYNMCTYTSPTNSRTAFVTSVDGNAEFRNLTFSNAYVCGTSGDIGSSAGTAVVIGYQGGSGVLTMTNVHVKDSLVVGGGNIGSFLGRGNPKGSAFRNCTVRDSVFYGDKDHTASFTGCIFNATVENSFSVGCTVISCGKHSGGFISCANGITVRNCFTDVMMYGSEETGAFIGALNGNTSLFENCYTSGFIEGKKQLGGFIGHVVDGSNLTAAKSITFNNCYTTAMVGMRAGGEELGGFAGNLMANNIPATSAISFTNCYAAGEVGSTDTDLSGDPDTGVQPEKNGGFIGAVGDATDSTNITVTNCYYDKQTTAMREWAVGDAGATNVRSGVKGVLTTDTTKAPYTGLTSTNIGAGWDASQQYHFPELTVFRNASAADWGDAQTAALVQAYSLSSTSGPILDTWDESLDIATGLMVNTPLDAKVYCTVRDLTSGFPLTSTDHVKKWTQQKSQDATEEIGASTDIKNTEYRVLSLKNNNGQWLCDELIPGVTWLRVTCEVDGQPATRLVRVIPTVSIEAGSSVIVTDKYDHADEVRLFFSTPKRLADGDVITTGIYPDCDDAAVNGVHGANAFTEEQKTLMGSETTAHVVTAATPSAIDATFHATTGTNGGNDAYTGINVNYMSVNAQNSMLQDNATGSTLYTYVWEVTDIDDTTGAITRGALLDMTDPTTAAQFNGYEPFGRQDKRYMVSYAWVLQDGRVVQDAKLVREAKVPFDVALNVYKNSIADANLYTNGAQTCVDDDTATVTSLTLKDAPRDAREGEGVGFDYKTHAITAWKLNDASDTLQSVKVTLVLSESESYSAEITNPVAGQEIDIHYTIYRIVFKDGGFFTIPEVVHRKYTLQNTGDIWYLRFNKNEETAVLVDPTLQLINLPDLVLSDVESNIRVDVVATSSTGDLQVTKELKGDAADVADVFSFTVALTTSGGKILPTTLHYTGTGGAADGTMSLISGVGTVSLQGGQGITLQNLPSGTTYTVTEVQANQNGYTTTQTGDSGTISPNTTVTAAFVNTKNAPPTPPPVDPPTPPVDPPTPPTPPTPSTSTPPTPPAVTTNSNPVTGDESNPVLWLSVALAGLLCLVVVAFVAFGKNKRKK